MSDRFPETRWSLVANLGETAAHRTALTDLCRHYWRPVHAYVRAAWSKSDADAADLTQAFFLWLLEGEALRRYSPERGGFRVYLKVLLRRFVGHQKAALDRLKRGGGRAPIPIPDGDLIPDPRGADPEAVFDRTWIAELVNRAVERARATCGPEAFAVYDAYEFAPAGERPTYAELAARLGLTPGDVKRRLFRVREAVRQAIRADLREATADSQELEEEWRGLFGS